MQPWHLFLGLALLSALSACGGGEQRSAAAPDAKVYRVALDQAPTTLDPAHSATLYANAIVINVYDTLFRYKYLARPYELTPSLAVDFPEVSADGLTYTLTIREGVTFIDDESFPEGVGREVLATDVVYSMKRHFDPKTLSQGAWFWQGRIVGLDDWGKQGADYMAPVAGLKATGKYTVQFTLTKPYPQLIHTLAQGFAAVVPKEAVDHYGREFPVNPVGSGPFKLTGFDTTRAVMVRNDAYREVPISLAAEGFDQALHGGLGLERIEGQVPPLVDRLEVNFIAEESARITSLTKGDEVHVARIPSTLYDQFLADKKELRLKDEYARSFHIQSGLEAGFVYYSFNMDDERFGYRDDPIQNERNKALRCAINKAFDWSQRNDRYYSGMGKVFPGAITPSMPEFDPALSTASIELDLEGARALMAEHNWNADTLPELVYGMPSTVLESQYFEQFRGFMDKIAYPADKIVPKQYATFGDIAKAWKQSRLPLIFLGWNLDYPDAENTMQLFYGPNGAPGSNMANYSNPDYDRLFEQAAVMMPSEERTAIYRRMNQMIIDDCVAITGISRTMITLWDKRVIAYPDRSFVGGFYFPFVDVE